MYAETPTRRKRFMRGPGKLKSELVSECVYGYQEERAIDMDETHGRR